MNNLKKGNLDLEPIYTFLTEDTSPADFAKLLDEFLFDYTTMLVRIQLSDDKDKTIHEHTSEFIFYLKLLRDILPDCEERR